MQPDMYAVFVAGQRVAELARFSDDRCVLSWRSVILVWPSKAFADEQIGRILGHPRADVVIASLSERTAWHK